MALPLRSLLRSAAFVVAGMAHLRSPFHDLPWYQQLLLDVIGFAVLVVLVISFLVFSLLKCCFSRKISGSGFKKSKRD